MNESCRRKLPRAGWACGSVLLLALGAGGCRNVDVVIARKDSNGEPPAAQGSGGATSGGSGGISGSGGIGDSGGIGGSGGNPGSGGATGGNPGSGGATGGNTGGGGGGYGLDGPIGLIEDAGVAGAMDAGSARLDGKAPPPSPPCPEPVTGPTPPFFNGHYIEIGNLLLDDRYAYLKVWDCCVDSKGYTLRVSLVDGQAQALHVSARYHTGLAQDDANLYLSAEEGLKVFSKTNETLIVHPVLVFDALAVAGGLVFGANQSGTQIMSVAPDGNTILLGAMTWSLADLVADADGVYATNRNEAGQIVFFAKDARIRVLVTGGGGGGDLAADDQYLYWAFGNELRRTRKSDGATDILGTSPSAVSGVTVDATHVYFTSSGTACTKSPAGVGKFGGGVHRVAKAGGPIQTLADDQVAPTKIAVGGGFVYWVAGSNQDSDRVLRRLAQPPP
jgi:hypothetical protein